MAELPRYIGDGGRFYAVKPAQRLCFGPVLPLTVFGAGIFLAFKLRFCFFLHLATVVRSFFDKTSRECGISPLKSVMLALAGTLGVGNIVGVASAITVGGAGSIFWMLLSALVAMAVKYSEIVLTMLYRTRDDSGWHGGAYRYIALGMSSPRLANFFAALLYSAFSWEVFPERRGRRCNARDGSELGPAVRSPSRAACDEEGCEYFRLHRERYRR